MTDFFKKIVDLIGTLPKAWKIVTTVLLCALAGIIMFFSATSCSVIRVVGNEGSTTAKVRQSALDSMEINIKFNPLSKE